MTLRVAVFTNGVYRQNCYIAGNDHKEALIIDPGSDAGGIAELINSNSLQPVAIICTHAHFDHVGAVADLMDQFSIPFFINGNDAALLRRMNLYKMIVDPGAALRVPAITRDLVNESGFLQIANFAVNILNTPGHTPGGVCFRIEDHIFIGDTVLPAGVGRIDLPGGDADAMAQSLKQLSALPKDLTSHPGHGASMPLGELLAQGLEATSTRT